MLGLEMGADDYVVKPFSLKELAARCRAALRRREPGAAGARRATSDENFEVEFDAYVLRYQGAELRLTAKEFELFRCLVERAGRVLTRERLLERVWGTTRRRGRAQHRRAHPPPAREAGPGAQPRRDGGRDRVPVRGRAAPPAPE